MIDHFVTIYHKSWIEKNLYGSDLINCNTAEKKIKLFDDIFRCFKINFNEVYPNSYLHVITDDSYLNSTKNLEEKNVIYYNEKISKNFLFENFHLKKFELYSMFDFPFMYIDFDVIFIRNFSNHHIRTNNSFNVYRCWRNFDYTKISSIKIKDKFKETQQFNNGIIWVAKKDKNITKELIKIHKIIFKDKKKFIEHNCYHNNDEFALSYFIKDNNLKMMCFEEVNKPRVQITKNDLKKYQTIHYWGNTKDEFVSDYKLIRKNKIALI